MLPSSRSQVMQERAQSQVKGFTELPKAKARAVGSGTQQSCTKAQYPIGVHGLVGSPRLCGLAGVELSPEEHLPSPARHTTSGGVHIYRAYEDTVTAAVRIWLYQRTAECLRYFERI